MVCDAFFISYGAVDELIMRCGAEFEELRRFLIFNINNYQTLLTAWGDYAPAESQDVSRRISVSPRRVEKILDYESLTSLELAQAVC